MAFYVFVLLDLIYSFLQASLYPANLPIFSAIFVFSSSADFSFFLIFVILSCIIPIYFKKSLDEEESK